jgi:PAS domain S-box-containing protein
MASKENDRVTGLPILWQVLGIPLLLVALLALMGYIAREATAATEQISRAVEETLRVLNAQEELLTLIVNLETGLRGFGLTGDEAFLEPYQRAEPEIPARLATLREQVADSPVQLARLDQVEALIEEWRAVVAEPQIAVARAGGDVRPLVATGEGKRRIDAIRAEMRTFQEHEEQELAGYRQSLLEALRLQRNLELAAAVAATLALALSVLIARQIARPIEELDHAAARIASGQLDARAPLAGSTELVRTASTFNRMAEVLAESREALQLEATVAERARVQARSILDAASEAMILVSPQGEFRAVNHRFTEMFGRKPGEILGRRFSELQEDVARAFEDPSALHALVAGSTADGTRQFTEIIAQRWPEPRELELYSTPVRGKNGTLLGRLFVFRDVTHEREVDRLKSEFIALASHELRTPLTAIKGYLDLLLEIDPETMTEEQREYLSVVESNTNQLISLTSQLLDVARLESGKIELQRSEVDLDLIVYRVAQLLQPQIEAKAQQLIVDLADQPLRALGDASRIT